MPDAHCTVTACTQEDEVAVPADELHVSNRPRMSEKRAGADRQKLTGPGEMDIIKSDRSRHVPSCQNQANFPDLRFLCN